MTQLDAVCLPHWSRDGSWYKWKQSSTFPV